MGAVFALFSGWYFWIPKLLGLDYNLMLGKVHFWLLFIGVFAKNVGIFNGTIRWFKFINYSYSKDQGSLPSNLESEPEPEPEPEPEGGYPKSESDNNKNNKNNFVEFFENVKINKRNIYKHLKEKSGIYLFINNITKDLYVGSSINLSKRMAIHFYHASSDKDTKIVFYRAMKKYKLDNFSLAILEYCNSDNTNIKKLEQKWIDYYEPKYNVLKIAGTSSGLRHTVDTINKLKELFSKEKHPKYGSIVSIETRKAISDGIKEFYRTHNHPSKGFKGIFSSQYGIGGKSLYFYNKKGEELIFPSINAARLYFKVRWSTIKNNIDTHNWITLQSEKWIIQSKPR